ncbi:hypothetical protein [Klebsiella pneumoniae]|uniref:hypothetical protein n=1 Tax=Klebsiella pneumoniae TaxID=573 RepID=UPI0038D08D69|nr:hypothetical protein [Klebsiella pneumoniae]
MHIFYPCDSERAHYVKKKEGFFMSSIRTLTFEEITKVSGEGHGSEWARDKRDAAMNASLNGAGAGYSAIPNIDVVGINAAGKYVLSNGQCITSVLLGAAQGIVAAKGGSLSLALQAVTSLRDVASTCNKPSGVPFR